MNIGKLGSFLAVGLCDSGILWFNFRIEIKLQWVQVQEVSFVRADSAESPEIWSITASFVLPLQNICVAANNAGSSFIHSRAHP